MAKGDMSCEVLGNALVEHPNDEDLQLLVAKHKVGSGTSSVASYEVEYESGFAVVLLPLSH